MWGRSRTHIDLLVVISHQKVVQYTCLMQVSKLNLQQRVVVT